MPGCLGTNDASYSCKHEIYCSDLQIIQSAMTPINQNSLRFGPLYFTQHNLGILKKCFYKHLNLYFFVMSPDAFNYLIDQTEN